MQEKERIKPKYNILQNVGWMCRYAWSGHKNVLATVFLGAAIAVGINLAQLYIAPVILDKVEQTSPLSELLLAIVFFALALFLLTFLQAYLEEYISSDRISLRMDIISDLNAKICGISFPLTLDPQVQKLRDRCIESVCSNDTAGEHIWTTLSTLLAGVTGFAVYAALLTGLDPVLLLLVAATSAVSFAAVRHTSAWRYRHQEEEQTCLRQSSYITRQACSVALAKDIRIFGLAPWLSTVYDGVLKRLDRFYRRCQAVQTAGGAADLLMATARNALAYIYLIWLTLREGLSASEFLLYFNAVSGFGAWVTEILTQLQTLRQESLDLNAVRQYMEYPEPFRFEDGTPAPRADSYELRLEQVSYRYPSASQDTLHEIDLTVRPGENLAIVGLNGAGKTTLVRLLCGFLDPTQGRVLLNGQDIRQYDRRDYYTLFSAVFQDFSVLDATVAENVAQSRQFDTDRVWRCLEQAGLTEKIRELPNGLDTHVGREVWEDGVLFSGGQIQRLMLARALYKDGPILVLDEPTAALDPIAENDIYQKYSQMTAGKTSLFISHRLASTRFCDRILFIADGRIAEEGTHDALLAQGGLYADLFHVQSRYYQEGRDF